MTPVNELLNLRTANRQLQTDNLNQATTIKTLDASRNDLLENAKTLQERNEELEALNARLTRMLFGRKSEKTLKGDDPNQHSLFEVPVQEEPEPAEEEEKEEPAALKKKPKKKGPKKLPENLPTKELILPAPDEQKVDAQGNPLALLGYDISERLEHIAAQKIRVIIKREKWGYKDSREVICTAAPLQAIVPKGKFMDSFVLYIIFQKFFMGLPLYRQLQEHNAGGLNLAKSTFSDAVQHFSKFFMGVYFALKAEVFSASFIHADETPIKCQKLKKGEMKKCYFWVFRSKAACFFHFGKTRSAKELETVFDFSTGPPGKKLPALLDKKEWAGHLLTDAYASYQSFFKDIETVILLACWAHVRRKFEAIYKSDDNANTIFRLINELYRIEKKINDKAKAENWAETKHFRERYKVRQKESKDIVDKIESKIMSLTLENKYTPKSSMSKALKYTDKLFEKLKVYLTNGELPIDNNAAERAIKPVVIGRKNYLFVGSEDAGTAAAVAYSIIESCRQADVSPQAYLSLATQELHAGKAPEDVTPSKLKNQLPELPQAF